MTSAAQPPRPPLVVAPIVLPDYSTKEGWAAYVDADEAKLSPPSRQLSARQIRALSDADWAAYARARLCWFQEAPYVWFPATHDLMATALTRLNMNARTAGARPAIALDGPSGVGKTGMLWLVGRQYEKMLRALVTSGAMPPPRLGERCDWRPTIYLQLNSRANPTNFNTAFVNSYGPLGSRGNAGSAKTTAQLTDVLSMLVRESGTVLVLVDDIHFFFWMREEARAEIFNHLKSLASRLGVTFIFAGVELLEKGFFEEGTHGSRRPGPSTASRYQVAGRTARITIEPFAVAEPEDVDTWRNAIAHLEARMLLGDHEPESLPRDLWKYLHERTGGRIGSLSRLLGDAVELAITQQRERVDKRLLDQIVIDEAAEAQRPATSRRRARRGRR